MLSKSADMLWKAWRFESKLRKLAGNFNGGLVGCRGEHRRINCKRLYRRLSRIFKAPLSPIHTRSKCIYICDIVIVGGLIKACYAASRPSSQTRRRFNIYENYPIVSNIVGDRGSMRHVRMMSFKDRCAIILRRVSSPVYAPGACLHALLWVISWRRIG